MRRFHDSLIRCFRCVMLFDRVRTDAFFGNEFNGGAEKVMEEPPFIAGEGIEKGYVLWMKKN